MSTTTKRFEAADPLDGIDTADAARRLRARALAVDPIPARPVRRRLLIGGLATGGAAVAATAVFALAPSHPGGDVGVRAGLPGPVAAFADAIADAGLIHVRTVTVGRIDAAGELEPVKSPERSEGWYATDGSARRTDYVDAQGRPDGVEVVVRDGEYMLFNHAIGGLQQRYREKDAGKGPLLLQLRDGLDKSGLRVIGRATIDGRDAYEVACDLDAGDGLPDESRAYVAVDDGKLLAIDQRDYTRPDGTVVYYRTRVETYETLPADASKLQPSPEFRGHEDDVPAYPGP